MSTLSSKGQVTVPIEVRRKLALDVGDRLRWVVRSDGVVEITREESHTLRDLAGMLAESPRRRARTVSDMDAAIGAAAVARDEASRARRR